MNLPKRLLVSRSEKHLQKYRDAAKAIRPEFLQEYLSHLSLIKTCYAQAGYWHGTGRYHYYHANDSRYEDADGKRLVSVFESILKDGALTRHQDLWVRVDGQFKKTVSVAPSRMHARLYAHVHLREGVWLEYVFGGTKFWTGFFIFIAAMEILPQFGRQEWGFIKQTVFSTYFLKHARTWASAICNLDKYAILPFWRAYDLRSDIAGNHAILFGIKRSAIQDDGILPFMKKVEVRVGERISLSDMTHVEVPLTNVAETEQLLAQNNITLPVIPLEFGELYCSQFPLTKLAYV
jgi:hypothetical protein